MEPPMHGTPGIRFVAINGSERTGGNTADILDYCSQLLAARDASLEVVDVSTLDITPCGPCGDCLTRTTPCAVEDGVTAAVERMTTADGIIFAAPVHGFGTAGPMQAFIERAGVGHLRFQRPLTNKVGGVIVLGRRYSHTEVFSQLVLNVLLNRMIMIGSGFPAIVYGDRPGEARHDDEGLDMVSRMVDRMLDLAELLAEHRRLTGAEVLVPRDDTEWSSRLSVPGGRPDHAEHPDLPIPAAARAGR
ncbi:flavodoxin family protein [Dactylosporangium roseum]